MGGSFSGLCIIRYEGQSTGCGTYNWNHLGLLFLYKAPSPALENIFFYKSAMIHVEVMDTVILVCCCPDVCCFVLCSELETPLSLHCVMLC